MKDQKRKKGLASMDDEQQTNISQQGGQSQGGGKIKSNEPQTLQEE